MHHLRIIPEDLRLQTTLPFSQITENNFATFHNIIDTYGFIVVTDVLPPTDISITEQLFDNDLFSIVDLPANIKKGQNCFRENGGKSSVAKRWPFSKFPLGRYIPTFASDYGMPHGQAAWFCRRHPNMLALFQALYRSRQEEKSESDAKNAVEATKETEEEDALLTTNEKENTDDLCVGLDNPFFDNSHIDLTVPDQDRQDYLWPHADQNPHAPGGEHTCYQSVLYIWESNVNTSSTVVWPESHRLVYPAMMESMPVSGKKGHYCQLPPEQHEKFAEGAVRVVVPQGGVVVWNSKTIHQGWNEGPRLAFPVCMEPRSRRSAEALDRKRTACAEGLPTTHWASLGVFHGSGSKEGGGSKDFPLISSAHKWMYRGGVLDPTVEAWL